MYDVLIVGAGPAGNHIAGELAARGYKALVLEQHKTIGKTTCCTGIVGKECLDAFPVGREAILREARSAIFFTPSGQSLRVEKETTQAYILDRHAFDSAMARAAQKKGAEYLLDTRIGAIHRKADSVLLEVEGKGAGEDFQGKAVVVSSGFGSKLPQSLGLGKSGDFVMGAQAEVEAAGLDEVEVFFGNRIAPGFFAWLVPTTPGRALAGLLSRHNTGSYMQNLLDELYKQGKIASPEAEIKYGGIPLKPLPGTYGERLLVVGDAAGQVKPTTGGGIYYGLLAAQMAADTLYEAFSSNDFSAGAFGIYEKKWKKKLSRELKVGYYARRLFERMDDRQIEHLFNVILSKGIHERMLKSEGFSFDWHGRLFLRGLRYLGLRGALSLLCCMLPGRLFGSSSGQKS